VANGLLLGYAQVPVERMDALVERLAECAGLCEYERLYEGARI
jgi:hypothetical protein